MPRYIRGFLTATTTRIARGLWADEACDEAVAWLAEHVGYVAHEPVEISGSPWHGKNLFGQ